MELKIKHYKELTLDELHDIYRYRVAVFVVEQNCPYQEVDGNDKKMVSFTEFHRTSSNFYLKFDDGTVLWESQLCRPMFAVKGTSVSEKVEFCSVIWKEGTVSYFKDIDPIDLWERLKGKTFRVKAESGYKRPQSEGCDVSELIQRIKQSVERDEIEKIYRLAHNSVLYSFIEQ